MVTSSLKPPFCQNQTIEEKDPAEIATLLAFQVEKWYEGGKKKRDEIVAKLRQVGFDDLADEIITWYKKGDKKFGPLTERLRKFKIT